MCPLVIINKHCLPLTEFLVINLLLQLFSFRAWMQEAAILDKICLWNCILGEWVDRSDFPVKPPCSKQSLYLSLPRSMERRGTSAREAWRDVKNKMSVSWMFKRCNCNATNVRFKLIPSYRLLSITIDCSRFLQERSIIIDKLSFLWLRFRSISVINELDRRDTAPFRLVRDQTKRRIGGRRKKKSAISFFFAQADFFLLFP